MNVKISHEIPLSIINEHQDFISDYMFVLLHKILEDKEYANLALEFSDHGEIIYLDNSCFELGESLDNELLYEWYQRIEPEYVILPDVLGNKETTLQRTMEFVNSYPDTISQGMPVAQGATQDELIDCYKQFRDFGLEFGGQVKHFDIIGIPFVYSWADKEPTTQANERIKLLKRMVEEEIIDLNLKHHLLGTWQAREFSHYRDYNWIYSVDTSNPVMAALDGDIYGNMGRLNKPKSSFDSVYNLQPEEIDFNLLYKNVDKFREIVTGEWPERKYPDWIDRNKYGYQ